GNPHRTAPLFVLRLADDEPREDLAVQASHRGRREDAFRRASGAHHRVHARTDDRRGDARGEIAVANQADARAGGADVVDQLLVPIAVEDDDDEIFDAASEASRDVLQVLFDRRVEADHVLRAWTDDELLHVEIGRVKRAAPLRA